MTGAEKRTLAGHGNGHAAHTCLAVFDHFVVTEDADSNTPLLYDTETGALVQRYEGHTYGSHSCASDWLVGWLVGWFVGVGGLFWVRKGGKKPPPTLTLVGWAAG